MIVAWLTSMALGMSAAAVPVETFSPRLALEPGQTVIVDAPVSLPGRLRTARVEIRTLVAPGGVDVLKWGGIDARGRKSRLQYAISAGPEFDGGVVRLVAFIRAKKKLIKRVRIRQAILTAPLSMDEDELTSLIGDVEGDGEVYDVPPEARDDRAAVLVDDPRLIRWAAARRLKAVAREPDDRGRQAYLAVGRVTPTAPLSVAEADVLDALQSVRRKLGGFDIRAARDALASLRTRSELSTGELARLLELLGCVQAVEGRDPSARKTWLQALSLYPELQPSCPVPWGHQRFQELRDRLAPDRPLRLGRIVLRATGDRQLEMVVKVAPDPGRIARTAEVWVRAHPSEDPHEASAAIEHAQDEGQARFVFALTERPDRQLPVRARILDTASITLAEEGYPDPLYVPIQQDKKRTRVPAWVWWVAGSAVVAGAATAGIVYAVDSAPASEPNRGLGPADIRF